MSLIPRIVIALGAATLVALPAAAPAQTFSPDQQQQVESIVKQYLVRHPHRDAMHVHRRTARGLQGNHRVSRQSHVKSGHRVAVVPQNGQSNEHRNPAASSDQTFSADQRQQIGSIVKEYLVAHPEVRQNPAASPTQTFSADQRQQIGGIIKEYLDAHPEVHQNPAESPKNSTALPSQTFSADQRQQIGSVIKEYLVAHPEVIQEVMAALDKQQKDAEAQQARATIIANKATLFNSQHQVVLGNPQGKIEVVEFFDYNCGFCKHALPDMMKLMDTDHDLKFVLKEFPVLGEGSVEAAHVAVAARMQDPTGAKYIQFHQKLLGGRGVADKARALAVAKEVGFDMARIQRDMASPEVTTTIAEDLKLADALGVNGTPSYVVGDELVVGAVGFDELKKKIDALQK